MRSDIGNNVFDFIRSYILTKVKTQGCKVTSNTSSIVKQQFLPTFLNAMSEHSGPIFCLRAWLWWVCRLVCVEFNAASVLGLDFSDRALDQALALKSKNKISIWILKNSI